MTIEPLPIVGVKLIRYRRFDDARGCFVKTFHEPLFKDAGLETDFREDFWSRSRKGCIRGMHFQLPPHDHAKLVFCIDGRVLDVFLDLRKESETFGRSFGVELSGTEPTAIYLPRGLAHGFLALEEDSVMYYKVTTVHAPTHDTGIRWDSFGYEWGTNAPIISPRDESFAGFDPQVHGF